MTTSIRFQRFIAVLLALLLATPVLPPAPQAAAGPRVYTESRAAAPRASSPESALDHTPLYFEANMGQTDPEVRFLVRGAGAPTFITDNEMVAVLPAGPDSLSASRREVVRMRLAGAERHPVLGDLEELPSFSAYFIGNDPSKWRDRVAHYGRVGFRDVYPGIDLMYHGTRGQLEYDFIVQPGADPSRIALEFEGIRTTRVDANGDLLLETGLGEIRQHRPNVYQTIDDRPVEIAAQYKLHGNSVSFDLAEYDHSRPLVVDPVVTYWIVLGGDGPDFGNGIAIDSTGAAYVVGETFSTNFPTKNAFQSDHPSDDIFVTKLSPTGGLVWSTYLGGNDIDSGLAIALENDGAALHITGYTSSTDFPTAFPYQLDQPGRDAFVSKLVFLGSSITFASSTYLGGIGDDVGNAIAVNNAGYVAVTGSTESPDFPSLFSIQPKVPGFDVFVTVFKPQRGGTSLGLYYSTFLNGDQVDRGRGLYWDSTSGASELVVAGDTQSRGFPQYRSLPRAVAKQDAFIARISSGTTPPSPPAPYLVYSAVFGGTEDDSASSVSGDAAGAIYVAGSAGINFPLANSSQGYGGGEHDAFVTKFFFTTQGWLTMPFSTYVGGSDYDNAHGIAADPSGQYLSLVMTTASKDLPVIQTGWWPNFNAANAYVARLSVDANNQPAIFWSGYLLDTSEGFGIAHYQDAKGIHHVYLTGYRYINKDDDVFVIKIDE
jgi:hypothetical protein